MKLNFQTFVYFYKKKISTPVVEYVTNIVVTEKLNVK